MRNKNILKLYKQIYTFLSIKDKHKIECILNIENAGDTDSPHELKEESFTLFKDFIIKFKRLPLDSNFFLSQNGNLMVENDDIWITFEPNKIQIISTLSKEGSELIENVNSERMQEIMKSIN